MGKQLIQIIFNSNYSFKIIVLFFKKKKNRNKVIFSISTIFAKNQQKVIFYLFVYILNEINERKRNVKILTN